MKRRNKLILEFTEFNAMRLNPDSAQYPMPNVTDPNLSVNAFDKHQDAIRAGVARINSILGSLSNTRSYSDLKSKFQLEEQNIESIKILRIVKLNINYDVYISFIIKEKEYWGKVKNILDKDPEVISELFKDVDLLQPNEWVIKIKGTINNIVKTWLIPENGEYELINNEAHCIAVNTGRLLKLECGSKINVVRTSDNKITIKYMNDYFILTGDNFIYFNWWFMKSKIN